jgi:hypothetical protein
VRAVLEASRCVDCEEPELAVLEFHHIGRKRGNVTRLAWNGCSIALLDAGSQRARCAARTAVGPGRRNVAVTTGTAPP